MNLNFSGRGLAYLAHFMATNDIRYYLNGVRFQPLPAEAGGGVLGAATNGHILGMWHDKDGSCDRGVIATISRQLATACKKPGTRLEAMDGRLAAIRYADIQGEQKRVEEMCVQPNGTSGINGLRAGVAAWEVEGNFPDLLRVVQDRSSYTIGATGEFNAEYLALVDKALRAGTTPFQRRYGTGITMHQRDKDSGLLVLCPSTPEALAVIMPRRGDSNTSAPWLEAWRRHGTMQQAIAATPLPAMPSDAAPPPDYIPQRIPHTKR